MFPVLLDMVDEFYNSLDDQSKTFANGFPLLFVPQGNNSAPGGCGQEMRCRRGPMKACQKQKPAGCPRKCQRGQTCAEAKPASDVFQTSIDVQSFQPEEITVKVKDHEIIVEGKHEERQDKTGFISRQFSRRCILPQEFDPDTISTFLNAEGKMTIKATKPQPPAVKTTERIIPIQRVPTEPSTSDQEWEKVDEAAGESLKKPEQAKE